MIDALFDVREQVNVWVEEMLAPKGRYLIPAGGQCVLAYYVANAPLVRVGFVLVRGPLTDGDCKVTVTGERTRRG